MNIELGSQYLIISKDRKMIAKGVPRNRYICLISEADKKRVLTYSSKGMAESGFKNSGFYLSDNVKHYIKENYPELVREDGWVFWDDKMSELFEAVEFTMELTERS